MEASERLLKAVKEYRGGSQEAFTAIYEESSKYLYVCIQRVIGGNDNAQDIISDIMQDTYLEIVRYIDSLEEEEKFLSWAGRIATNKCYAYVKKNKKYVLLDEEDATFEQLSDSDEIIPETIMQNKEKQRLLKEIIDTRLTEMQRLCIVGYYYNGQKQSEIAKELGIPENTVKTNLARGKAKIEEGVKELERDHGTRLYSVAPFFLLLLNEDIRNAVLPKELTASIFRTIGMNIGTGGSAMAATGSAAAESIATETMVAAESAVAKEVAKKVASKGIKGLLKKVISASVKTKVMTCVAALGIAGASGGVVMYTEAVEQRQEAEYWEERYKDEVKKNKVLMESIEKEKIDVQPSEEANSEMQTPGQKDPTEQEVPEQNEPENSDEVIDWAEYYLKLLSDPDGHINSALKFSDLYDFDRDGIPEIVYLGEVYGYYGNIVKFNPEDGTLKFIDYDFDTYHDEEENFRFNQGYLEDYIITFEEVDYVSDRFDGLITGRVVFHEVGEEAAQAVLYINNATGESNNDRFRMHGPTGLDVKICRSEYEMIKKVLTERMQPYAWLGLDEQAVAARIKEIQMYGGYKESGEKIELLLGGGDDGVIDVIDVSLEGVENPTWQQAYKQFLLDSTDAYVAFDLHDFDSNDTPELICYNSIYNKDIYTYYGGKVREVDDYVCYDDRARSLVYGENPYDLYEIYEEEVWDENGNRVIQAELVRYYFTYSVETDSCMFVPYDEYLEKVQIGNVTFSAVMRGKEVDKASFLEQHEKAEYRSISAANIAEEFDAYEKGN